MANFCPYCDGEIGEAVLRAYAAAYPFGAGRLPRITCNCTKCGKLVGAEIVQEPFFRTYKKDENESPN